MMAIAVNGDSSSEAGLPPEPKAMYSALKGRFGDITPMTFVTMPSHLAINPVRIGAGVAVARHPGVLFPIAGAQFSDSGIGTRWCCRMNQMLPFNILQQAEVEVAARFTDGLRLISAQIANLIKFAPSYVDNVVVVPLFCNPGYSFGLINPEHSTIMQPVFDRRIPREDTRLGAIAICQEINHALGIDRKDALHAAALIDDMTPVKYTRSLSESWDVLLD